MSLVIDSSVTLAWFFADERNDSSRAILDMVADTGAWAPAIWRLEVANGFLQGIRQRRIDERDRNRAIDHLLKLDIAIDPDTIHFAWTHSTALAERFRLTTYDACYLELAQRRELPLATLDQDLRAAAKSLGVPLL